MSENRIEVTESGFLDDGRMYVIKKIYMNSGGAIDLPEYRECTGAGCPWRSRKHSHPVEGGARD